MATNYAYNTTQNSSQRGLAMVLALVSAVVLSPFYVKQKNDTVYETIRWNSLGFVLPMVLVGLIIAIKTTSSSSSSSSSSLSMQGMERADNLFGFSENSCSWVMRIGSSSWGLAGVLVMLMLVLSWQDSVQHLFWR